MMYCICCSEGKKPIEMALEDVCWPCYKELNALYHRKPEKLNPTTLRNCLKCGDEFESEGVHNRICKICRLQNKTVRLIEKASPHFSETPFR